MSLVRRLTLGIDNTLRIEPFRPQHTGMSETHIPANREIVLGDVSETDKNADAGQPKMVSTEPDAQETPAATPARLSTRAGAGGRLGLGQECAPDS